MPSNIAVKITADTIDLTSKLALAKAEMNQWQAAVRAAANDIQKSGTATDAMTAKLREASAGLVAAKTRVSEFGSQLRQSFGDAGQHATRMGGLMEIALDGAKFLIFEEIARQALEKVKQAFEKTIGAAEEFGLSNAKFAKIIGTSTTEAAGLSEALKGVGVSTEQYETMALKLSETIGAHEEKFRKLGVATRDASGALVGGKAAFDAVSAAMRNNPINDDAIAYTAFGKKAKDAFDVMRLGEEDVQHNIALMRSMGVQLGDTSGSAAEMERSLNDMRIMWESMAIALGQRVMPVAIEFMNWAQGDGKGALQGLGTAIKVVVDTFVWLGTTVDEVATGIAIPLAEMTDMVVGFAVVSYDVFTLKWSKVIPDAKAAYATMEADLKEGLAHMTADLETYAKTHEALFGAPAALKGGAYGKTGGGITGGGDEAAGKKAAEEARRIADERAQIEERAAIKHVDRESHANDVVLALGRETDKQWMDQANLLEDARYAAQLAGLKKRAAADKGDKVALMKDLAEEATLFGDEQARKDDIYGQYLQKKQAADRAALQTFISSKENELTVAKSVLADQENAGEITAIQRDLAEIHLTQAIEEEVLKRFDAEHEGLDRTTKLYEDAMRERHGIVARFNAEMRSENRSLSKDYAQEWAPITSGFRTMVQGIMSGNQTLVQTLARGAETVATDWIEAELKSLEQTIFATQAKVAASAAGDQATVASHEAAKAEAGAADVASGSAQIMNDASKAAAGAYSAVVGIPIVGPVLAPIAAGVAFGAVAAFDTLTSFDVGTNYVPYDMTAKIHAGERIIPAADNRELMGALRGGQAGSAGGGGDVHVHFNLSAMDTQTGVQYIQRNVRTIASDIAQHLSSNGSSKMRFNSALR